MPTVDLRFVVHNKEDLNRATKSLEMINKVSITRNKNYDKEAAAAKRAMTASERLIRLEDKLIKQRLKDNLVGEARTRQIEAHERILQQEIRTLQDYIDTDKLMLKQQKESTKSEANLAKQREKTKNDTEKLRMTYDSTYAATKRYKQGLKDIDRAFEGMEDGPERASRAIKALKADYDAFIAASKSGKIVDAGNQFARYGDQAYRAQQRTKRFASVGLQQAGYQVNDFIVQVASGQNALVAFGQQGSQLAGIFGTGGAVVGALIAGVSALGNLVYQYYQAKNATEDFAESLDKLPGLYDQFTDANDALTEVISAPWQRGREAINSYMKAVRAQALQKIKATGEELVTSSPTTMQQIQSKFTGEDPESLGYKYMERVKGIQAGKLAELEKELGVGLQNEMAYTGAVAQSFSGLGPAVDRSVAQVKRSVTTTKAELDELMAIGTDLTTLFSDRFEPAVAGVLGTTSDRLAKLLPDGSEDKIETVEGLLNRILRTRKNYEDVGRTEVVEEVDALIKKAGLQEKFFEYQNRMNQEAQEYRERAQEQEEDFQKALAKKAKENAEVMEGVAKARIKAADVEYKRQKKIEDAKLLEAVRIYKERIKLSAAQEKAAEGGARVQLKYQNAVAAARAKLKKAQDDDATAQRQEKNLAAKVAEEQVRAQYESLRLKNGQLQLTKNQTTEMDNQIRLARAAATQAVVLKYEAETAAEQIREQAEAARDLANQIERAARAYETFLTKGQSEEIKLSGLKQKLRVLKEGGTSGQASAAERLQVQRDKITAETNEQRRLQRALGDKRTETEAEITAAATKRLKTAQQTYDVELKIAKEQKSKTGGGKTPKSALDILLKEERSMKLKLDQREALIGLTDQEILLENTKYALMSKVQEQMATMSESDKAATLAKIEGIAQEMAAREEQLKLMEEIDARNKHIADTMAESFGSAMTSIVDGTKSVSDAFKDMARAIIAELYQIFVVKQITGMISSAIYGGLSGGTPAGGYSPGGKTYGSGAEINAMQLANGGAFYGGNVIPFANGGVVGHPTNFGMSGGRTGLMGEAGPEAIMPLKRGKNGKLGVQAEGGAGDVIIHQNFNFQANGDESVKKIIAQAAPQIANMTKSSIISDRRRGGQIKATFG